MEIFIFESIDSENFNEKLLEYVQNTKKLDNLWDTCLVFLSDDMVYSILKIKPDLKKSLKYHNVKDRCFRYPKLLEFFPEYTN